MQIQANLVFHLKYFLALFVMLFSLVVGQRTFSCWNSWGTCRIHLFFLVEFMGHIAGSIFFLGGNHGAHAYPSIFFGGIHGARAYRSFFLVGNHGAHEDPIFFVG